MKETNNNPDTSKIKGVFDIIIKILIAISTAFTAANI